MLNQRSTRAPIWDRVQLAHFCARDWIHFQNGERTETANPIALNVAGQICALPVQVAVLRSHTDHFWSVGNPGLKANPFHPVAIGQQGRSSYWRHEPTIEERWSATQRRIHISLLNIVLPQEVSYVVAPSHKGFTTLSKFSDKPMQETNSKYKYKGHACIGMYLRTFPLTYPLSISIGVI